MGKINNIAFKIQVDDNQWIDGIGYYDKAETLILSGMLPACNSTTIRSEIINSTMIIEIGGEIYDIEKVYVIDEDALSITHSRYKEVK